MCKYVHCACARVHVHVYVRKDGSVKKAFVSAGATNHAEMKLRLDGPLETHSPTAKSHQCTPILSLTMPTCQNHNQTTKTLLSLTMVP